MIIGEVVPNSSKSEVGVYLPISGPSNCQVAIIIKSALDKIVYNAVHALQRGGWTVNINTSGIKPGVYAKEVVVGHTREIQEFSIKGN